MGKIVRKTAAECRPTPQRRRELAELAALPDNTIDLSDIPELTDEALQRMVQGVFYRPSKKQITLRLDTDVVDWLKKAGPGYQTRANALLRRIMEDFKKVS